MKTVFFETDSDHDYDNICEHLTCADINRKDGKNVIFKLVDYPAKESKNNGN